MQAMHIASKLVTLQADTTVLHNASLLWYWLADGWGLVYETKFSRDEYFANCHSEGYFAVLISRMAACLCILV